MIDQRTNPSLSLSNPIFLFPPSARFPQNAPTQCYIRANRQLATKKRQFVAKPKGHHHRCDLDTFIISTRPKPAYGRQGLYWDRWARIQFSQVHFGAKLDSTDLLWCKNVTSPTGGSNRPFRCLEEGGRALPKFLAPFQNVSKKHSGYDLLLNKYSGGYRKITIWM